MNWTALCMRLGSTLLYRFEHDKVSLRLEDDTLQGYDQVEFDKHTAIIFARRILNYYDEDLI
jgi:hypothetical protein